MGLYLYYTATEEKKQQPYEVTHKIARRNINHVTACLSGFIEINLPFRDNPSIDQLPIVIVLGNMDQHAVPREKLVVPQ